MTEQAAGTRATCKSPGCEIPPAPATRAGRPPGFCELEEHNKLSAWRERQRLDAEARGDVVNEALQAEPVTYSLTAGAELLRQVRAAGERQRTDIDRLIAHLDRLADPTSSEVEVATARTEFQENVAVAERRATAAERRATAADRRALTAEEARDLANGAAEELARRAGDAAHRRRRSPRRGRARGDRAGPGERRAGTRAAARRRSPRAARAARRAGIPRAGARGVARRAARPGRTRRARS